MTTELLAGPPISGPIGFSVTDATVTLSADSFKTLGEQVLFALGTIGLKPVGVELTIDNLANYIQSIDLRSDKTMVRLVEM